MAPLGIRTRHASRKNAFGSSRCSSMCEAVRSCAASSGNGHLPWQSKTSSTFGPGWRSQFTQPSIRPLPQPTFSRSLSMAVIAERRLVHADEEPRPRKVGIGLDALHVVAVADDGVVDLVAVDAGMRPDLDPRLLDLRVEVHVAAVLLRGEVEPGALDPLEHAPMDQHAAEAGTVDPERSRLREDVHGRMHVGIVRRRQDLLVETGLAVAAAEEVDSGDHGLVE